MTGTKDEFLELLTKYQGILHKVNLVYFRNDSDRKDNFQEIVYQLWKSFPDLKNTKSIGSWIYAVSINTSLSKLKKDKRMEFHSELKDQMDGTDVFEELVLNEDLKLLLNAIHRLDEIDKPLMLLYLEEKSYEEIAEILGISVSNAGVRINRAKEKLKKQLKPYLL